MKWLHGGIVFPVKLTKALLLFTNRNVKSHLPGPSIVICKRTLLWWFCCRAWMMVARPSMERVSSDPFDFFACANREVSISFIHLVQGIIGTRTNRPTRTEERCADRGASEDRSKKRQLGFQGKTHGSWVCPNLTCRAVSKQANHYVLVIIL